jgi:hypothetical protein
MRLRKYLCGKRIRASVMQFSHRRLWLLMGPNIPTVGGASSADTSIIWLCLALRDGPSLHFLKTNAAPKEEILRWPSPDELTAACAMWRQWPVLTPALRRTLSSLDEKERAALLTDLQEAEGNVFIYRKPETPNVCLASAWPLPPELRGDLIEEEGENVPALLEKAGQGLVLLNFAEKEAQADLQSRNRRRLKLERLQERLKDDEKRLAFMLAAQDDALLLRENLWRLPDDIRGGRIMLNCGEGGATKHICLAAGRTARQEMEYLFHTAKRGRRGLVYLARRRVELERELAALAETRQTILPRKTERMDGSDYPPPPIPKNLPKNVRAFISDDGFIMLRGRDAEGNLAARKLAAPHDIWLHATDGPGSHVIIRRAYAGQEVPERTFIQAGILAACKSWAAGAGKALIIYAEVRHVKTPRNAPKGTVRMDKTCCSRKVTIEPTLEDRLLIRHPELPPASRIFPDAPRRIG